MTVAAVTSALPVPPMPRGGEKFGAWFDHAAADAAAAFFPTYLRHTEGEWFGKPFVLQPWQRDQIIRPLFGWKTAEGFRLIREVFLCVPRKNGKTELAAGVALLALLADAEFGGQVYSAACDENQAKIVFQKAGVMVGLCEELSTEVDVFKTSIYCSELMASFKPLSSKAATKHGFSPSGAIYDEVHVWPDGELRGVIHDGMGARRQPLELFTTTAGVSGEGFGWEMYEYATAVRDGDIVNPRFLPVIFEADEDADWRDLNAWRVANPGFGVSPKVDFAEGQIVGAEGNPRKIADIRRFHLNQWVDHVVTTGLDMAKWDACRVTPVTLESLRGRKVWGGLDLSATTDLTALSLFARSLDGPGWDVWRRFWMPVASQPALQERVRRDRVPYDKWIAAGLIRATAGDVVDYDVIRAEITGKGEAADDALATGWQPIASVVDLQELAIDRWNATHVTTQLTGDSVTVVPFGQGFASMSAPSKEYERLVNAGHLNHGGDPVIRWMASCVAFAEDEAGNMKPVKPPRRKTPKRIDGIVADIMALGRAMVQGGGKEPELTVEAFFGGVA